MSLSRIQDPTDLERGQEATATSPTCSLFQLGGRWWHVPAPFLLPPSPKTSQMIPGDGALLQLQSSQFTQCLVSPLWLPVGAGSSRKRGARRDEAPSPARPQAGLFPGKKNQGLANPQKRFSPQAHLSATRATTEGSPCLPP